MDRNEILRIIRKSEEICRKRKLKRSFYTILFYTAVNMQVLYWQGQIDRNISSILSAVLFSVIISVITFVANIIIFDQLFRLDKEDEAKHEMIKKKLEGHN